MIGQKVEDGDFDWGETLPVSIYKLERALDAAFHAFDDMHRMSFAHRVRVVTELGSIVPDAASEAARAGQAGWARTVVRRAQLDSPPWGDICDRWDEMLLVAFDVIDAAEIARSIAPYQRPAVHWAGF